MNAVFIDDKVYQIHAQQIMFSIWLTKWSLRAVFSTPGLLEMYSVDMFAETTSSYKRKDYVQNTENCVLHIKRLTCIGTRSRKCSTQERRKRNLEGIYIRIPSTTVRLIVQSLRKHGTNFVNVLKWDIIISSSYLT